jgi:ABC-type lipopolysaccharide export system ATPase subunit
MVHPHRVILVKTIFKKNRRDQSVVKDHRFAGRTKRESHARSSHYGYVLETGRIMLHDFSSALRANEEAKSAYLGGA